MNEAGTLAFFCSIVAAMTFGEGLAARPPGQDAPEGSALPSQRYHDTDLTVPLADGDTYLGDIAVTVRAGNQIAMSSQRLLDLLTGILEPAALARVLPLLAGRASIGLDNLGSADIGIRYDPQKIELVLDIPAAMKQVRTIQLTSSVPALGSYQQPATFSGFLTVRGAINYVERGADKGLGSPILFLDGATRIQNLVLESQAVLQPGMSGPGVQRLGSRIVYDDIEHLVRWTAGDVRIVPRGFQSAPDIAGISLFRSYSTLQPQMITRPTGQQSFRLERASTVEIRVNDQLVRRVRLQPGNYNLRDFPYTQGIDNARILVRDDSGATETLKFNLFSDQSQLAVGLSEFGLFAGVKAPLGRAGPIYSSEPAFSGFYRRGLTDRLTLGANIQADRETQMAGIESILSMPFGSLGANLAVSQVQNRGMGYAALLTFHSLLERQNATADVLDVSAEIWSDDFAPAGSLFSRNPSSYRLGASYSHAFTDWLYAGADLHYSKGRESSPDSAVYRASIGWRPLPRMNFTANAGYLGSTRNGRPGFILQATFTLQLGANSSAMAAYDSALHSERLSYQMQHGNGAGSYNLSGALERTQGNLSISGSSNYITSAGELGLDHLTTFGTRADSMSESRSSLRFSSSIAFADGAVSVGRPISDSFAIVDRWANVGNVRVKLDSSPFGYTAGTTLFGTATQPDLISYNPRTVTIDAPQADADVDLGTGAFRVLPPYRSGYRLRVGSDYPVTAIGRMLNEDGAPLSLVAGLAFELTLPLREPLPVFTNRDGRFGLTGIKSGRWRIEFQTAPVVTYIIEVPPGATGMFRMGDLTPVNTDAVR
ncbi:MAG: outer membrane usher protein [Parasphingorhabdus sp.]